LVRAQIQSRPVQKGGSAWLLRLEERVAVPVDNKVRKAFNVSTRRSTSQATYPVDREFFQACVPRRNDTAERGYTVVVELLSQLKRA